MNNTAIEWAEKTWNPVTGCSPVSEGCEHCYAERMSKRLRGRCGYPEDEPFKVTLHPDRLEQPLRLKKPSKIFVCSMGDLFHEDVPTNFIDRVLEIVHSCKQHTFKVLTKRPENIQAKIYSVTAHNPVRYLGDGDYLENLWLGVTAENQARADERVPILRQTPAAVRFVSCEPLLGPVDLEAHLGEPHWWCPACEAEVDPTRVTYNERHDLCGAPAEERGGIDWVICGGETGPGARPMHPDWVRHLRDQCQAAGVPFCFKSWGNWIPKRAFADFRAWDAASAHTLVDIDGEHTVVPGRDEPEPEFGLTMFDLDGHEDLAAMARVGKRAAGRQLDGREWDEYPEVS